MIRLEDQSCKNAADYLHKKLRIDDVLPGLVISLRIHLEEKKDHPKGEDLDCHPVLLVEEEKFLGSADGDYDISSESEDVVDHSVEGKHEWGEEVPLLHPKEEKEFHGSNHTGFDLEVGQAAEDDDNY